MAKRLRYAIINHERHTVRDLIEEDVSLAREYSRRYHSNMVVDYIEANGDDVEGVEDIFDAMETYRKYRNRHKRESHKESSPFDTKTCCRISL